MPGARGADMIPRGISSTLAAVAIAVAIWALVSGSMDRRRADRADARADSLATEAAAGALRELGWETTLAGVTRDLVQLLEDSVATVLEAARSRPIVRTVVEATAGGSSAAELDSVASGPDSSVYRIRDDVLSGTVTAWRDSAVARLDWTAAVEVELVHSVAADGRLLLAARPSDPRVSLAVPELAWSPPPPPPGPSRLRWLLGGIVVGVIGWEIVR